MSIAAEVRAAAAARQELLGSISAAARRIFAAEAASIAVLDEARCDFTFAAVSGAGADRLVGRRFPSGEGLAGVVVQTGEPLVLDDLSSDPRFARALAEESGYVPRAMMVAPLLRGERVLGVLSVLDRGDTGRGTLDELGLLVAFATQAAVAVEVTAAAERARAVLEGEGEGLGAVADTAARIEALEPGRRAAGRQALGALTALA